MSTLAFHMFASTPISLWIAFHVLLLALLAFDAGLSRAGLTRANLTRAEKNPAHSPHTIAIGLTVLWVVSALLFALWIGHVLTPHFAAEYLAGYGIEESLSIDNLFVFLLIFKSFDLNPNQQRRVLFWGVFGAIALRACMMAAGLTLMRIFAWASVAFGVVLLLAALRLLRKQPRQNSQPPRWISFVARYLPLSPSSEQDYFFVREQGRLRCTHLFLALVVIELADAFFAVDSIPAVLAVSHHPFVVYASNIFAVVGLRSLYFVVAGVLSRLQHIHYGLAAILFFMAAKLLLIRVVEIPIGVSLGVLGGILGATILLSLWPRPAATSNEN